MLHQNQSSSLSLGEVEEERKIKEGVERKAKEKHFADRYEDPTFYLCWRRQSCGGCLTEEDGVVCSWCPLSSICVPNHSKLPILAPLQNPEICPFGASERWELRTRPLGCQVSMFSLFMSVGAVVGTLLLIGLLSLAICVGKRVRASWRRAKRGTPLWNNIPRSWRRMRVWKRSGADVEGYYYGEQAAVDERSPLLGRE